jgi:hypothetical protein
MKRAAEIHAQLVTAGLAPYLVDTDASEYAVSGRLRIEAVNVLRADARFASGLLYQLHKDVGRNLTEFRAHPGEIGPGSLQIVIDKTTGRFYADLDRFNPYSDLVNVFGHTFGEVVPHWLSKVGRFFRRKGTR